MKELGDLNMNRKTHHILWAVFLCAVCTSAVHAQGGKIVKQVVQSTTRAAAEATASNAAKTALRESAASGVAAQTLARQAGSRQLEIRFPGDPVQLELPFEQSPALPKAPASTAAVLEQKVAQTLAAQPQFSTLPSGEKARVVKLEEKHFKKTNKLNTTVGHYMAITPNPVELYSRLAQGKVKVFRNDKLRYFSDLKQVCPVGSYLLRYENGKTAFFTPEQAPESLKEAYENIYKKNNPSSFYEVDFVPVASQAPRMVQLQTLGSLFTRQASGVRLYQLPRHPLTGQPVEVAVLERPMQMQGLAQLNTGATIVRYPDASFDVHPADLVPPVLQDKIAALQVQRASFALEPKTTPAGEELLVPANVQPSSSSAKVYDSQTTLAQDLHRSGLQGKKYISPFFGEAIVYEIPAGTVYKPAGRGEEVLDPAQKVVAYFPQNDDGQIMTREALNSPLFSPAE